MAKPVTSNIQPAAAADTTPAGDAAAPDAGRLVARAEQKARQRVRDAQTALNAARQAAAGHLPGGGYVIATEPLYVAGGARAHNPGDRVPVGNVDRNGWPGKVRPPDAGE